MLEAVRTEAFYIGVMGSKATPEIALAVLADILRVRNGVERVVL